MIEPQRTESIITLVEGIDSEQIALPEFQRDFVWDMTKTLDLFDSLVREIFIGAIIYGKPSFEITTREIDTRPRKTKGKRRRSLKTTDFSKQEIELKTKLDNFRLVLDGQQRATSLYRALKGIDDVWFIVKDTDELEETIKGKNFNSCSLEDIIYEFNSQEDESRLCIKLSDVYKIMTEGILDDDSIKEQFFNELKYIQLKDDSSKKEEFKKYRQLIMKVYDLFKSDKLLSYYLLNMSTEKFALFFERSNSRGVQLNFIDILAAKLYTGFNLRKHMEQFENENPNYRLNREIIVRAISFIVSDGKKVDKSYILSELNYQHFNDNWDLVCQLYKKSLDFLYNNYFIISQSWMPYENMIIPLMIFLKEIKHSDFSQMTKKQYDFLKYWNWASILSQKYSSGSNDVILYDSNIMKIIARGGRITDKSFFNKLKIQIFEYDDIYSFTKKANVVYQGILNLINFNAKGLLDWNNNSVLSFNSNLEDHHIFPVEFIKTVNSADEQALALIDCVANRTLIPKITNIKIGKNPPSNYLTKIKHNSNPLIKETLRNHLIPEELIDGDYDDVYLLFLEDRAKQIFELIKANITDLQGKMLDMFYQEPFQKEVEV
ncbi:DUF262 domain-containing protein [Neobacillus sp. MER 74]|uniref:GmrSD restriction endonuclease domain-containing protein n=1 Tax=Neobacillus sp. MER 74 TaxID=2939566 RepID=UPI0020424647|nr:DUF262 domain-containing protein [Neobacillus sp. MER 74]MCM3115456.1 DUF262 domain-containing protein [Neobacillus sp. MER 74]